MNLLVSIRIVDGIVYAVAFLPEYGWSTGPCADVEAAIERAELYVSGADLSEVPDGIASRGEMVAARAYVEAAGFRDAGATLALLDRALADWTQSDDWIRASSFVVDHYPMIIKHAGTEPASTRIRLATADGAVRS